MKKYPGVLKRVREIEAKRGISYIKPEDKLYKGIKIIHLLCLIWAVMMSIFSMISYYFYKSAVNDYNSLMITIGICSGLIVLGYIVNNLKGYITGALLSITSSVLLILTFARELEDATLTSGYKPIFYYRHLIPLVLVILTMLILCFIAVRAKYKTQKLYKNVLTGLYDEFERTTDDKTDENWEKFLEEYNK